MREVDGGGRCSGGGPLSSTAGDAGRRLAPSSPLSLVPRTAPSAVFCARPRTVPLPFTFSPVHPVVDGQADADQGRRAGRGGARAVRAAAARRWGSRTAWRTGLRGGRPILAGRGARPVDEVWSGLARGQGRGGTARRRGAGRGERRAARLQRLHCMCRVCVCACGAFCVSDRGAGQPLAGSAPQRGGGGGGTRGKTARLWPCVVLSARGPRKEKRAPPLHSSPHSSTRSHLHPPPSPPTPAPPSTPSAQRQRRQAIRQG